MLPYRPEIDGLRALAILPVILFHGNFSLFSGGYVGVDVFFVISGFLITSIILKDISRGTFSLLHFYERRALRILPALIFIVLVSIPPALILFNASSMKDFSQSVLSVATFSSNFLFWKESGYFDVAAELKPLLHTWSLAVEDPSAAFYLLPFRAWELLIGVLCAFYVTHKAPPNNLFANNIASATGLLLIAFAIFTFDVHSPIPGAYALIPTLGAALIIVFAHHGTLVHRLLSTKCIVGLGLISYSTYLWHQPILSFARIASLKELTEFDIILLLSLSVLLAFFSWKYIEQPFRGSKMFARKAVLPVAFSSLVLLTAIGLVGQAKEGQLGPANEFSPNVEWASFGEKVKTIGLTCDTEKVPNTQWLLGCYFGDQDADTTVVVYGDSHGQSMSFPLDDHFKSSQTRGMMVRVEGCDLVPYTRSENNRRVTNCIVTSRWTLRLYPIEELELDMPYRNSDGYVELGNKREYNMLIDGEFHSDASTKKTYLSKFLVDLSSASKRLFLTPYPPLLATTKPVTRSYKMRSTRCL